MIVYLVVGPHNSGKSTLIRHLSGLRVREEMNLALVGEQVIRLWVSMRSAQEDKITVEELIRTIEEQEKKGVDAVLVSLRLDKYGNLPDCEAYIRAFKPHWEVQRTNLITASTEPTNAIADRVRREWGFM